MYRIAMTTKAEGRYFDERTFSNKEEAEDLKRRTQILLPKVKVEVVPICDRCGKEKELYVSGICKECYGLLQTQSPCYDCKNEYVDACSTCWVTASEQGV